jgi:hypothetical protein
VSRFEQCLEATGTVTVDGRTHEVRAGAHRDRSWGPREWRQLFTLGDLQAPGRQLYFVGRSFPGLGMGFLREEPEPIRHLVVVDGAIDFDDDARTIRSATLRLEGEGSARAAGSGRVEPMEVTMRPIAESVAFDMAHTCEVPERWLYWRTLVEAHVDGWDEPCRGWFETNRYGVR